MRRSRAVARAATGMGAATALSRALGFLRVLVVAAVLGTTYLGNTFQASNAVSNVLFDLVAAGALSEVLVPTFVRLFDGNEPGEAERLAGEILGLALVVLGAITVVGVIAAPWLARLLSTGSHGARIAAGQQQLATFLLRFFVPQVLLYALGTVAIAVLYAKRRFVVTALAPIGNTVVMVAALVAFRSVHGTGGASLSLGTGEKLLLAGAGTLGVAAFVGIPVVAVARTGFRLRPRLAPRDPAVSRLLRLSGWTVLQHAGEGLLLGAAIILGNAVAGGVVAYQVGFVFFLAPYAVLAQPIHTAILPELGKDAHDDPDEFARSVRWGLDSIAILVVPCAAALVALALPAMQVVAFGRADTVSGVTVLAAALASLAVGLYGYSSFFLFTGAFYAMGDSRTPAVTGLCSAVVGVGVMALLVPLTHGAARVAALGLGHSAAYALASVILGVVLARRTGRSFMPRALPWVATVAAALAAAVWAAERAFGPSGRVPTAAVLVVLLALAGGLYVVALRLVGLWRPGVEAVASP